MIMPRGQQLLLPVNPGFIAASIVLALAVNLLPIGEWVWAPDWLLLILAFWGVHQPQRVGMGIAFLLGLCMDVQHTALLGQHALSYTVLMFAAHSGSRRLRWFNAPVQALQMLPLFLLAHAVSLVVRMLTGGVFPGVWLVLAPLLEALLWPVASWLLLAPQRRAPDKDENRPL